MADVPSFELTTTVTTNDIVINKLTQILSYLRQGKCPFNLFQQGTTRWVVLQGTERKTSTREPLKTLKSMTKKRRWTQAKNLLNGLMWTIQFTETSEITYRHAAAIEKGVGIITESQSPQNTTIPTLTSRITGTHYRLCLGIKETRFYCNTFRESVDNVGPSYRVNKSAEILNKLQQEPEGYAECYPGLEEMNDAIDDSDDEVDYSKMDLGKILKQF